MGTGHFITLSEEECLELLSTRSAGRLAWTLDDDIELMPVTHQVVGHSLVMRIAPNAPHGPHRGGAADRLRGG
ncbi:pyridoxamine 5'-phosphate oxidase family protein [Cutibacterium granulosum DSM 20700]|uniref:Uncharacterized protein n=1 Tax=Cutibacterium granulosum DSM 20700 TaxID=1160719 RepID=A0A9X5LSX7_9ACTN|nr:pyridoxamine 5'-phosphate oxidase family protein [Cutibacterium granulosum DSM 20700]